MKHLFLLLLVSISIPSFAQLSFKGIVTDSLKNPLELASIVAINKKTKGLEAYTITNENGQFSLELKKNSSYQVQLSYIGLKSVSDSLQTFDKDIEKDFVLLPDFALDEVELVYKMPIVVKGDTVVYNADSYTNGSERKLEDIIDKLPGVEINESGQIEVEGKVVNKLTVNGKDFFDGDTKIATKNIPSSAVDKIQVLRNYSEVGQLSSVRNNQDNVAINIKLKEGKESFWFGDITTGAGNAPDETLYLAQPKLFYYSPKYTLNFIGDFNNIGEVALSRRDIRGFSGGFRAPSSTSGTSINLGDNSLNFLTNQSNALRIQNKLATTNFSYSPTKALDLSGFVILNNSEILSKEANFVQYTNPDIGIPDEATEETSTELSSQALVKLSASYKPNFNNQLDYDVVGRTSDDQQDQNIFSSIVGNTSQKETVKPYSINQNLSYYYTLDANNIFALEAQHLLKDEDPLYNAILENNPDGVNAFENTANALGLNGNLEDYNINQNRNIKSNQLDAKLDYYHIISPKSNINITLGTILSQQEFNSNIFQFLDNNATLTPLPEINNGLAQNDTEYAFKDFYIGLHLRFRTGKFTFTPGFSIHNYGNKNTQFGIVYEDNFVKLLPDFETRIQLKKGESLTLNYSMRNQFTDITRLAEGLVFNNFNSLQYGNAELQNALSNNLSMAYSSFNLFNYTNVFARAAYSNNIDQIRSLTSFDNVIRTSSFFNSNFADESLSFFGRIQRTFGKIRASVSSNLNYSKINQFIQGTRSLNEGFTQTYTPGIRTNFKVAPNVNFTYRYTVTNNNQGNRETTFTTRSPGVDFDAYIKQRFTLRSDFSYTTQDLGNGQSQSFRTWNASLSYRKDKDAKWEYQLRASNLLNIDSQVRNSANNLSVFSAETFIQPRFVTFRFIYSL